MPSRNPGQEGRLYLLNANRDAISVMLARAVEGGLDPHDAVAVIVDQRDPLGSDFAEAAATKAGLNADREASLLELRGEIPTAIIVVTAAMARLLFRETHPTVAKGLSRELLPGHVRVVVIADGAAMLVHAEVPVALRGIA